MPGIDVAHGAAQNTAYMGLMPAKKTTHAMTANHKAALAEGRAQGRAVRLYLEALEGNRPKRGRKRTPEAIERRLAVIEETYSGADAMTRLGLTQERINLEAELALLSEPSVDMDALEKEFIANAAPYAARKGLSYAAFREVGVQPAVLARAGIKRG